MKKKKKILRPDDCHGCVYYNAYGDYCNYKGIVCKYKPLEEEYKKNTPSNRR
ncbi:MAG: hypothetical protein J6U54_08665 [Clostridiales bacterium]|nr:hypothetical protein [Clostridiales bacterium]